MARRADPIITTNRTRTNATRSSGRSASAAATTAAMTTTKPTSAPPSPIQRRGGCSVISHHPPAAGDGHADDHGNERGKVPHREADENQREHERAADRQPGQCSLTAETANLAPCSCPPCQRRRDPCRHRTTRHARRHHTEHVIDDPTRDQTLVPARSNGEHVGATCRQHGAPDAGPAPARRWPVLASAPATL